MFRCLLILTGFVSFLQLGAAVWIEDVVFAWLTISDDCGLVDRVTVCLTSDNLDILNSCLSWLNACRVDRLSLADASIIQVIVFTDSTPSLILNSVSL